MPLLSLAGSPAFGHCAAISEGRRSSARKGLAWISCLGLFATFASPALALSFRPLADGLEAESPAATLETSPSGVLTDDGRGIDDTAQQGIDAAEIADFDQPVAPPAAPDPAPAPAPTAPPAPATTPGAAASSPAPDPAASGKPDSYLAQAEQLAKDPVGTRLIDVATPFTSGSRWLELLVTHRFIQPFNQGGTAHNLWGLDSGADVGIGFTYGVLQHLDVSVYRTGFQEDFELAAKYQFLQQEPGMPLSLAVRAGADLLGRLGIDDPHRPFAQLLLSRRFLPGVNLFVSPTWVQHTPLLNNAWNTPIGVTVPIPGHWLLEGEGIFANRGLRGVPGASQFAWHAAFTKPIGWHLFQIIVGNSRATTVDQMIGGDFAGGFTTHDLRLGFNLVRYFNL